MEKITLIINGCLWGLSNTLLEKTSFVNYISLEREDNSSINENKIIKLFKNIFKTLFFNLYFIFSFLIGQIGSVLFYYCLGSDMKLTTVVITANSISILVCFLLEFVLKTFFDKTNDPNKLKIKVFDYIGMLIGIIILLYGVFLILQEN